MMWNHCSLCILDYCHTQISERMISNARNSLVFRYGKIDVDTYHWDSIQKTVRAALYLSMCNSVMVVTETCMKFSYFNMEMVLVVRCRLDCGCIVCAVVCCMVIMFCGFFTVILSVEYVCISHFIFQLAAVMLSFQYR